MSHVDKRLKNKAEVLTLRVPTSDGALQAVALSADFLKKNPVYHFAVGDRQFVVVTSPRGANRVYCRESAAPAFQPQTPDSSHVLDANAVRWRVTEDELIAESGGLTLPRVPAQRAFWFGWVAQFPNTLLIK